VVASLKQETVSAARNRRGGVSETGDGLVQLGNRRGGVSETGDGRAARNRRGGV
jgi:hypothetical protein